VLLEEARHVAGLKFVDGVPFWSHASCPSS
jgi:hypothetical protein